ncbi:hypothetical protein [Pseudarthrobacter polychromogenes]|uniref:hypothetical protein n=1 Tax=Pseudarthrobacter polychromogenes TaxID=1676 RepID=UPI00166E2795|nr:hypothetical protein [Pseudarthrobacter polychromogenes]
MSEAGKPALKLLQGGGGGEWDYAPQVALEIQLAAAADPQIAVTLVPILETAERGETVWDESVVKYPMGLNQEVGELIVNIGRDKYRLYFAEPSGFPGVLLALKFGYKYGHDWKKMQNDDIREAGDRLTLWMKQQRKS